MTRQERRERRRTAHWAAIRHGITSARMYVRLLEMRVANETTANLMTRPFYDEIAEDAYDRYLTRDWHRHGPPTTR